MEDAVPLCARSDQLKSVERVRLNLEGILAMGEGFRVNHGKDFGRAH